jgi:hydroxymethylbilane synthase
VIKTTGDHILDTPLAAIGDKGLFTKELEIALLDGKIDLAVHSCKDLPTETPQELSITAILEREDARDVFLPSPGSIQNFSDLPLGATVATGSLRRRSQILHARPDLHIADIRGNLNTRLKKLDASSWTGMVLARAGVSRLGWNERIGSLLEFDMMLPAVGQGALAVEIRKNDLHLAELLAPLHHPQTASAVLAERALLRKLEGGCQIPVGAFGSIHGDILTLTGMVASLDGTRMVRKTISGGVSGAESLGTALAEELLSCGAREILDEIRTT